MNRKEMVEKLKEKDFVVEYLHAPSFAYQFWKAGEKFIIDRDGRILDAKNNERSLEEFLFYQMKDEYEYDAYGKIDEKNIERDKKGNVTAVYGIPVSKEDEVIKDQNWERIRRTYRQAIINDNFEKVEDLNQTVRFSNFKSEDAKRILNNVMQNVNMGYEDCTKVEVEMEGYTGRSLRNIINLIYSKQSLILKALDIDNEIVSKNLVVALNESKIETKEDFKKVLNEVGKENLNGVTFNFENEKIVFSLCTDVGDREKCEAINDFVLALNEKAKKAKYTFYKQKEVKNEKYALRIFLIGSLKLNGDKNKITRKRLLENLTGDTAWPNNV